MDDTTPPSAADDVTEPVLEGPPPQEPETPTATPTRQHRARHARKHRARTAALVALGVLLAILIVDLVAFKGKVHPRVTAGNIAVGGDTPAEATAALTAEADRLGQQELRFTVEERSFTTTPAAIGWTPEPAATADDAYGVGRSGLFGPIGRVRAWITGVEVPWVDRWDRQTAAKALTNWVEAVGIPTQEGRVWIEDGEVRSEDPVSGMKVDSVAVIEAARAAVNGNGPWQNELPVTADPPVTSPESIAAAAAQARTIMADSIRVSVGNSSLTLSPDELEGLFRADTDVRAESQQPVVSLDPAAVEKLLKPLEESVEKAPVSAGFSGQGKDLVIRPSVPGKDLDPQVAADALLRIALSTDRTGKIPLVPVPAPFDTEEANKLGIQEAVASFTTYYPTGEPRITNIRLGSELLSGTLVEPGQVFSLNERLGERTLDRGFVLAPAIYGGAIVDQVGGGISQLTTTLYNAAFFTGLPIVEHQAHSFWFDRYPKGREATLGWMNPDLKFRNDLPTPIVIEAVATESSVTVTIYGTEKYREVEATPWEITAHSKEGYTVAVQRIITEEGKPTKKEIFLTYYRNELVTSPTPTPEAEPEA